MVWMKLIGGYIMLVMGLLGILTRHDPSAWLAGAFVLFAIGIDEVLK